MKPADRALDIVAVGLGQAGGNLAAEFARLGYRSMALNTAHTDLSALAPGDRQGTLTREQRVYIGIDGYDGAGADLNYGRECIRESAERIQDAVAIHSEGADVVVLTAGLGGGTGSAIADLVEVLEELSLPIVTLTTLPGEHESGINKVNAARGLSELVKRSAHGWIFADNQRLAQVHGGVSLDKYFARVNQVIVGPLDAFNRLNNRDGVHPIRTLDGEDFRKLLLSSGVLNYADALLPTLSVDSVTSGVREALQSSGVMPSGYSLEEVTYMAVVIEAPESTLASTPFSFYEHLSEQLKNDTGGGALYLGVYRTPAIEGGSARLRLIGSSQSLPAGIQAVVNDAKREGGTLRDKLRRAVDSLDLGEIEEFDLFKTHSRGPAAGRSRRPPPNPDLNLADTTLPERIGQKSDNGHGATNTQAPEASAEGPPTLNIPPARTEQEVVTSIPPSGAVPRNTTEDPISEGDSEAYAKLADAFLSSGSHSIRRRIAKRLRAALSSDNPLSRYHSTKAIEKIRREDPAAFDQALATESHPRAAER